MAHPSNDTRNETLPRLWMAALLLSAQLWHPALWAQSRSTSVERFLAHGTDDAGDLPSSCSFTASDDNIYFGECDNGGDIISGFRFQDILVSNPEDIQSVHIEFGVDGPYENDIHVRFYGEAADNSQTFTSADKPSNRALTSASVDWLLSSEDAWNWTERHDSPDLTSILKEIIGRPGWTSGSAISIIVKNVSSNSSHRRVFGFKSAGDLSIESELPEPIPSGNDNQIPVAGSRGSTIGDMQSTRTGGSQACEPGADRRLPSCQVGR